jgi:ankyrin repeat protein
MILKKYKLIIIIFNLYSIIILSQDYPNNETLQKFVNSIIIENDEILKMGFVKVIDENTLEGKLFKAILDENYNKVELAISQGANVNATIDWAVGWAGLMTPLMVATLFGNEKICEFLIYKGADVNAEEIHGYTPLIIAAGQGYKGICSLLISKGARINHKDVFKRTALMYAANVGNREICELLISKGAIINEKDLDGNTALIFASAEGFFDICKLLILKGADITIKNNQGKSALDYAVENGFNDIIDYFRNLPNRK